MGFLDSLKKLFSGSGRGSTGKSGPNNRVDVSKRFDLRGRTGQGSMSKVYIAYDRELGRTICLKVLDKEKTAKFEDRFKAHNLKKPSEGEICMSLRHQNLVQTFEYGVTSLKEPFLIMELIDGLGLNYLIETKSPQLNGKRVDYLVQLCHALEYLHGQKFMHRDICPRNIMVDKGGVVKLIDFGLTIPQTPEFCRPGNRTGTADYLAMEVIKRMATDHRVDVFALGVTAFELFTGELPWERCLSSEETLRRHMNEKPRDPKALNPDLEDELIPILMKAIEKDPRARYSTVAEFRRALQDLKRKDY